MYFTGYPAPESPMNLIKASLGILLLAGSLLTSPASEAGLMGKTLSLGLYTNQSLTTLSPGSLVSITVTSTLEINAWNIPTGGTAGPLKIDFQDTQIVFSNNTETQRIWPSPRYIGIIDSSGSIDDFSSTTTFFSSVIAGLSDSNLTVTNNSIAINVSSLTLPPFSSGGQFILQVGLNGTTPPPTIPEPSVLTLMAGAALLLLRRKPRNKPPVLRPFEFPGQQPHGTA